MGRKSYEDFQDHVSSYEIIVISKRIKAAVRKQNGPVLLKKR